MRKYFLYTKQKEMFGVLVSNLLIYLKKKPLRRERLIWYKKKIYIYSNNKKQILIFSCEENYSKEKTYVQLFSFFFFKFHVKFSKSLENVFPPKKRKVILKSWDIKFSNRFFFQVI